MTITTWRLRLEPLTPDHADEMAPLLDDPTLHVFTGGAPLPPDELRERYTRQSRGASADGTEEWLNWIVRERSGGAAVGYVQATVVAGKQADLAWVMGSAYQGRGYAREAAIAMAAFLRGKGVEMLTAHIHPGHGASAAVARAIGLEPTGVVVDGEIRWIGSVGRLP